MSFKQLFIFLSALFFIFTVNASEEEKIFNFPLPGEGRSSSLISFQSLITHPDFIMETVTEQEIKATGIKKLPLLIDYIASSVNISYYSRELASITFSGGRKIMPSIGIYINGIPFVDITSNLPLLEILPVPVDEIEKIEIIRSTSSLFHHFISFAGAINIVTKKPFKEYSVTSAVSADSSNAGNLSISTSGQADLLYYSTHFNYADYKNSKLDEKHAFYGRDSSPMMGNANFLWSEQTWSAELSAFFYNQRTSDLLKNNNSSEIIRISIPGNYYTDTTTGAKASFVRKFSAGQISAYSMFFTLKQKDMVSDERVFDSYQLRSAIKWSQDNVFIKNNHFNLSFLQTTSSVYPYETATTNKNKSYIKSFEETFSFSDLYFITPELRATISGNAAYESYIQKPLKSLRPSLMFIPADFFEIWFSGEYSERLPSMMEQHVDFSIKAPDRYSAFVKGVEIIETKILPTKNHVTTLGFRFRKNTNFSLTTTGSYNYISDANNFVFVECPEEFQTNPITLCLGQRNSLNSKFLRIDNLITYNNDFLILRGNFGYSYFINGSEKSYGAPNYWEEFGFAKKTTDEEIHSVTFPKFNGGINSVFKINNYIDTSISLKGKSEQKMFFLVANERNLIPGYLSLGMSLSIHTKDDFAALTIFTHNLAVYQKNKIRTYVVNTPISDFNAEYSYGESGVLPAIFGATISINY